MGSKTFSDKLWTPRSVEETRDIYADWAESYDSDVLGAGYATPARLAAALAAQLPDRDAPILDFGCGTGLSGLALKDAGFTRIDGTDITAEMVAKARAAGIYGRLWVGDPGSPPDVAPGDYAAITATGVVSMGAAPPETLATLLELLAPGGLLALSYNDATLQDAAYMAALAAAMAGPARLLSEDYGPHLPMKDMKSTVYVLERK